MSDVPGHGFIRTVLGDYHVVPPGWVYTHEHLIIDSPLIAEKFPDIHLHDAESAVTELSGCRDAGVVLAVDAMPASAGRDVLRLAEVSRRTGVTVVAATGLHHDRYYGPLHWSNRVDESELVELFIADLMVGIDEFDYTGPLIRRSSSRAGIIKMATGGDQPDNRDLRNLRVAAEVSVHTGCPVMTHCEGGYGGLGQVNELMSGGVPASAIILSHVDKSHDLGYVIGLAETGAILELDQGLREHGKGLESTTIRMISALVEHGFGSQIVVGTDGARRSLWSSLGGSPGLSWLAESLPAMLGQIGIGSAQIEDLMRNNALHALAWRDAVGTNPERIRSKGVKL